MLRAWRAGDGAAGDRLLAEIYDELRRIARRQMRGESPGHTLQPTALVNEAVLRLDGAALEVSDRAHFLALCARTMRRVLIDHGRAVRSQKRGGDQLQVTLADDLADPSSALDILALEEVLLRLQDRDAQKAQVFELSFFGGLTGAQIAEATGLSPAKVHRELTFAKAWLTDELDG
jgi:RNA polymerase sigma factor (TIGR02999 family)